MPIYEYICPKCKTKFEEWQNIKESSALASCPKCETMSERIISNTSFILKGEGWYVTEYGNKKNTNSHAGDIPEQTDTDQHSEKSENKTNETSSEKNSDTSNTSHTEKNSTTEQVKKDLPKNETVAKSRKKVEKNND